MGLKHSWRAAKTAEWRNPYNVCMHERQLCIADIHSTIWYRSAIAAVQTAAIFTISNEATFTCVTYYFKLAYAVETVAEWQNNLSDIDLRENWVKFDNLAKQIRVL